MFLPGRRAGPGLAGCSGEGSRPDVLLREGGNDGRRSVYDKMAKPGELQVEPSKNMQNDIRGFEPRTSSMQSYVLTPWLPHSKFKLIFF